MKRFYLVKKIRQLLERRMPILPMFYRYLRDNRDQFKEPKMTSLGFKFNGNDSMASGNFEFIETSLVCQLLDNVDCVINIGANIGYYTCLAASRKKHVLAFEPMPQNVKYLLRNIKSNDFEDQVEVFPLALSNSVSIGEIFGSGTGASLIKGWSGVSDKVKTYVPITSLDLVLGDRLSCAQKLFIIDVEGHELSMLRGAMSQLKAANKSLWMIEISTDDHQPEGVSINPNLLETFDLFFSHGYLAKSIDNDFNDISREMIEDMVMSQSSSLVSHNFLFYDPDFNLNAISLSNIYPRGIDEKY